MILNFLSNFKFYCDCNEGIFKKSNINIHGVYVVMEKHGRKVFPSLRGGDVLMLTHMSTVANKII